MTILTNVAITLLLLAGLFYALAPHSVHVMYSPKIIGNLPHSVHQLSGAVMLLAALVLANNKFKFVKFKKN